MREVMGIKWGERRLVEIFYGRIWVILGVSIKFYL
jgi:hypothetical protein